MSGTEREQAKSKRPYQRTLFEHLTRHLDRFGGYHHRFAEALAQASTQAVWITGTDRDSCHRVWFELHEDLITTLRLAR